MKRTASHSFPSKPLELAQVPDPAGLPDRVRVVYLLGAGASHACVSNVASAHGILMKDLGDELTEGVHELVVKSYGDQTSIHRLANDVINAEVDFEHIITFLDESPSALHKQFANDLRQIFETVLRKRLATIEDEQGRIPDDLYFALLDMHAVQDFPEELGGFITLNYDEYLETAIERSSSCTLDRCVVVNPPLPRQGNTKVLKLHGSFGWTDTWPITEHSIGPTLWIPPGIQKSKQRYPFNFLWGMAREMMNCDVLRIIGCKMAPNDWDLISLLFSTRHTHVDTSGYRIEIIDSPKHAIALQSQYPYLDVQSILEIEPIGRKLVGEFSGGEPAAFKSLSDPDRDAVLNAATDKNWFRLWLKQKAETAFYDLGSIRTPDGALERLMEEA
jgi:hypothetical protein